MILYKNGMCQQQKILILKHIFCSNLLKCSDIALKVFFVQLVNCIVLMQIFYGVEVLNEKLILVYVAKNTCKLLLWQETPV